MFVEWQHSFFDKARIADYSNNNKKLHSLHIFFHCFETYFPCQIELDNNSAWCVFFALSSWNLGIPMHQKCICWNIKIINRAFAKKEVWFTAVAAIPLFTNGKHCKIEFNSMLLAILIDPYRLVLNAFATCLFHYLFFGVVFVVPHINCSKCENWIDDSLDNIKCQWMQLL